MFSVVIKYSDGTEERQDETFDTWGEADEYGLYLVSCCRTGNEVLHMSNPGDYQIDEGGADYEVVTTA